MTQLELLEQKFERDRWLMMSVARVDEPTLPARRMWSKLEMGRPGENVQVASSQMGTTHFFVSVQSVKSLVAQGKLQQAQKLAALLPADHLPAELLAVLRPPKFRTRAPRLGAQQPDREKDYRWISQCGPEYSGRWVALHRGVLLADAASLGELAASIDPELGKQVTPLFHRIA